MKHRTANKRKKIAVSCIQLNLNIPNLYISNETQNCAKNYEITGFKIFIGSTTKVDNDYNKFS